MDVICSDGGGLSTWGQSGERGELLGYQGWVETLMIKLVSSKRVGVHNNLLHSVFIKNEHIIYIFFLSSGYFLYSSALFAKKEGAMAAFTSPLNEKMTVCLQFQYWYEVNFLRTLFHPAFCKSSSSQNLFEYLNKTFLINYRDAVRFSNPGG